MSTYEGLAGVYDLFTPKEQTARYLRRIRNLWNTHGVKPKLVLDLACGTGDTAIALTKNGFEVIGVDVSGDMLSVARTKAEKRGLNILFLQQDMRQLDLYGTIDAAVCLCDGINYMLTEDDALKAFNRVALFLNTGGMFVFDVNTEYYFEEILRNTSFTETRDGAAHICENSYDAKKKLHTFDVTIFALKDGNYARYAETHTQRAYTPGELKRLLEMAGFRVDEMLDFKRLKRPRYNTERLLIAATKI